MENNFSLYSPNMLKTFQMCPRKFFYRYGKNISMPVNDSIFEIGKNIHALASYYLRKENIDKMEQSLSERELVVWKYLKGIKYFSYDVVNTEYSLIVRVGDYYFGGRIDALLMNGDEFFILDYKTGAVPKNPKYDFQTMIYILAVKEFFKTDKVKFVYVDLRNREEVEISYSAELGTDYEKRLIEIAEKINNSDLPEKKPGCSCEYSSICF